MKSDSSSLEETIQRILELSATAQITRRGAAKDSPEFHNLSGAIAAYGRVLTVLTELQRREEILALIIQSELLGSAPALAN